MNQPPDPFEFLKTLWGPMGLPLAGVMAPTLVQDELDRRIAELKSVENWLNMNLNVLRMTIQGLEMQKAGLAAKIRRKNSSCARQAQEDHGTHHRPRRSNAQSDSNPTTRRPRSSEMGRRPDRGPRAGRGARAPQGLRTQFSRRLPALRTVQDRPSFGDG